MIHIVRSQATSQQIADMLEALSDYIKLAMDVRRGVLAGGGVMQADCESALLDEGSMQEDVWGADWYPSSQQVAYESLPSNNATCVMICPGGLAVWRRTCAASNRRRAVMKTARRLKVCWMKASISLNGRQPKRILTKPQSWSSCRCNWHAGSTSGMIFGTIQCGAGKWPNSRGAGRIECWNYPA